jgi:hypothetical protein
MAFEAIEDWARGRHWAPRAVVLLGLAWVAARLTVEPGRSTIFAPIGLGIHEAGHLLFRFGGEKLCALGGSLLQCLAPVAAAVVLARRPDWFGVAFCGVWLGINLYEVAHYMADARAQALQLVTVGGGEARHDWNFLFGSLGLLRSDTTIAGMVRVLGFLVLWGSIASGALLVHVLWRAGRASPARGVAR